MRILNHDNVVRALPMAECIAAMERALIDLADGAYYLPLRLKARPEGQPNRMGFMPALRLAPERRLWSVKEICVTPANGAKGLDPHQGMVILHDGYDGRPIGIVDASSLTAIRTAAVTAVATARLAPARIAKVAIVGAGVQAKAHIEALRCIVPSDASFVIGNRTKDRAIAVAREMNCDWSPTIKEAIADADVVCTVTGSYQPILRLEWLKPGCHLNAVGSSLAAARELDGPTMSAASLFVDRTESAINESGEFIFALQEKYINSDHIRAELGDVLTGRHPGRTSQAEFTIFKSLGLAVEDLAAAELALENAARLAIGTMVDW
jgi:ornithine cyclodeaminase